VHTRKLTSITLPLLAILTTTLAWSSAPSATLAFVEVGVVPMDRERVMERQTVLVAGDTITAVGPAASTPVPDGATRIEAGGHYLIPGLAEMHAHIPGGQASGPDMERVLFLYVANGVTTARGMLGDPRHLTLRERASRGEMVAPTIYTSGPSLNGDSIPTPEAAIKAVRDQKAAGYDFLKIHPGVTRSAFDALAATAGEVGIRFAGHVPLEVGLARALEARYATIDHIDGFVEALLKNDAPVTAAGSEFFGINLIDHVDDSRIPALVAATREAGTAIVPTESLFVHLLGDDTPDTMARWPEMKYVSAPQLAKWIERKEQFLDSTDVTADMRRRFLSLRRKLLIALYRGGVPILLGSDAPQVWNVPGFSIHRELQRMVDAGLTPYQALELGTRNVAAFFATQDRTGIVEVGKRADLVLLEENPLSDITRTSHVAGVMLGGRWLSRAEIDRRLATYVESRFDPE
jgi:imidazolonepropionase-like amidohydrolase